MTAKAARRFLNKFYVNEDKATIEGQSQHYKNQYVILILVTTNI